MVVPLVMVVLRNRVKTTVDELSGSTADYGMCAADLLAR